MRFTTRAEDTNPNENVAAELEQDRVIGKDATDLPCHLFCFVMSDHFATGDELAALCKFDCAYRDCCFMCLTETWLQDRDADETVDIDGFTLSVAC